MATQTNLADMSLRAESRREEQGGLAVSQFLTFLENDMNENPRDIHQVPAAFWTGIQVLTAGVEVDMDAPLTDD